MARKKKTRRITDIMPIRKADKKIDIPEKIFQNPISFLPMSFVSLAFLLF